MFDAGLGAEWRGPFNVTEYSMCGWEKLHMLVLICSLMANDSVSGHG